MQWVVEIRSPALTWIFLRFTEMGNGTFLFIFMPLGYWLWRKDSFARIGAMVGVALMLMAHLKAVWMDPRPDSIPILVSTGGYGFPSGHAMLAFVVWGGLAAEIRRTWAWIVFPIIAVCVSFSRVYLGVHDVEDIVGGALLGIGMVVVSAIVAPPAAERLERVGPVPQLLGLLAVQIGWLWSMPGDTPPALALVGSAFLTFYWGGVLLERRYVRFSLDISRARTAIAAALSTAGVLAISKGLAPLFRELGWTHLAFLYIRVAVLGAWIAVLAPRLFTTLGLARRREIAGASA